MPAKKRTIQYRNYRWGIIPEVLLLLVFFVIQLQHINLDLWNDEIYTLKHFTLTSIQTTVSDYHVPNNHIFFNLINNIYLKFIGVDSLHDLLNNPWKLRIIPLFYSLCTLIFVYKIGLKFHNRLIAILGAGVLLTTIPYFNFSLQMRGYGLSTLLLVLFVYYIISHTRQPKKIYLLAVGLISAVLFYTIPSNAYFILSILFILGVHFILSTVKLKKMQIKDILHNHYFHLTISIGLGVTTALALYSPIFREVFMNDYVIPDEPFLLSKIEYYFNHIFRGMNSNRWPLVIIGSLGLLLFLAKRKTWILPITIFLSICLFPIIIVYVRGDQPPSRVFTVIAPFFSLLISAGIYLIINRFIKMKSANHSVYGLILLYSVIIFTFEICANKKHTLSNIQEGKLSQNMYTQYYSSNYQPLLDVTDFNQYYQAQPLPVMINGCMPHGIPHYLDMFDIPYAKINAQDSLLSISDSIYVITNHPYSFDQIQEYDLSILNEDLTYHNVLLLSKREQWLSKIQTKLDSLGETHKDSIAFVFNIYSSSLFNDFAKKHPCYYISESNKYDYGKLIPYFDGKPFVCYLQTLDRNSHNISNIIKNNLNVTDNFSTQKSLEFFVGTPFHKSSSDQFVLYYNDFDHPVVNEISSIDSSKQFSGIHSQKLDSNNIYSSVFSYSIKDSISDIEFKVSFMSSFTHDTKGFVVLDVQRKNKPSIWKANKISPFFNPKNEWQKVISSFQVKDTLYPDDIIKLYIWTPKKDDIWIDDLKVELLNTSSN